MFDIADCKIEDLSEGKAMEMTFRVRYNDKARNIIGYYWKTTPLQEVS